MTVTCGSSSAIIFDNSIKLLPGITRLVATAGPVASFNVLLDKR